VYEDAYAILWTPTDEALRQPPRTNALKLAAPLRTPTTDQAPVRRSSPAIKAEASAKEKEAPSRPGSSYPAVKISSLDVDAKPVYEPNGKPVTEIDMDSGRSSIFVVTEGCFG